MKTDDIIAKLQQLQIEQSKLIKKLRNQGNSKETRPFRVGDIITLCTGGVNCKKGDTARVTKTAGDTVHFKVLRNGHHTHKKTKNVRSKNE